MTIFFKDFLSYKERKRKTNLFNKIVLQQVSNYSGNSSVSDLGVRRNENTWLYSHQNHKRLIKTANNIQFRFGKSLHVLEKSLHV